MSGGEALLSISSSMGRSSSDVSSPKSIMFKNKSSSSISSSSRGEDGMSGRSRCTVPSTLTVTNG